MRRWLREPLLQCVLAGLALFVVYDLRHRDAEPTERSHRIELTADDLRQVAFAWAAQGRAAPSSEEIRLLTEARVREEILYREALALGLDQDDAIVRRRLAQKMEFLFEDVARLQEPTDAELRAWFATNAEGFTLPARITFRHVYFSPDHRGAGAREDAARALARSATSAADTPGLGDPFMFQDHYGERTPDDVARTFGPGFAGAVFELPAGRWAGPVESGYGWHLVRVDALTPARVPVFEEARAEVRTTWIEEQRAAIRAAAFEALRAGYEVVLPDALPPAAVTAMAAPTSR